MRLPISLIPAPRAANWRHCSLYPASNQRAASKLSVKPKTLKKFPPRRSTVATPPRFHRPINRRHATQQKEPPPLSSCPASKTCSDMGLRTVFTAQMPKQKRLFNAYSDSSVQVCSLPAALREREHTSTLHV
ncbi:hypothetical protein TNCV_2064891 [Trichonephila clavipes]|nr:hypothetical protein TNCV_2064891 [Trichonephila clavipes]